MKILTRMLIKVAREYERKSILVAKICFFYIDVFVFLFCTGQRQILRVPRIRSGPILLFLAANGHQNLTL